MITATITIRTTTVDGRWRDTAHLKKQAVTF